MLAKPNDKAIRQLARLNLQDFADLLDFLDEEARKCDEMLRLSTDSEQTCRLQGRSLEVHELIALIRKAPRLIDPNAPHPI